MYVHEDYIFVRNPLVPYPMNYCEGCTVAMNSALSISSYLSEGYTAIERLAWLFPMRLYVDYTFARQMKRVIKKPGRKQVNK